MAKITAITTNMFPTLALLATLLFLSPSPSNAQYKPPLYVFGDSLYDDGMTLYNGVKGAGAEFWPYGETYFKKPSGRYSDGRLIPDFVAQFAGLPFLQPYLLPGIKDFTRGINFASAGACVLVELRPQTINLKRQVDYFVQMVQKLKQQVGEGTANQLLSEAVYLFNIAGNDYVNLLQKNVKKLPVSNFKRNQRINMVIGNLTTHIKTIYDQGGRKFAFQNLGPLGCMPSMKYMLNFKGTCAPEPQELAKLHNAKFAALAKRLQSQLPGFKYSIYDFYTSLYLRVIYGSSRYGFRESQTACCGSGSYNGDFTCQKKGYTFSVCSNPSEYLWFDAAHPTDKANQAFSKEFWSGGSSLVAPYNLQQLFAAK
ncbi:GDSL lipase [Spinacia oleracea]|uniref:GDSL lipase n=1 Tax=Spinacia oleracea TaxID=3562 RepID=A0A9R0JUE5_SPIOL|nr:GDSL lipase-like [Spinacia oleracea]